MKIGTKVLHKETKDEHKLVGVRRDEDGNQSYTFERKESGDTVYKLVIEQLLEQTFYFQMEDHPSEHDVNRKKNRKSREKVPEPAPKGEVSALALLN
jgi:hypothetical protein